MALPIFVATHPRACSTAFERVFMTRRDILKCVHEPFGDAWYYGPERLAERYAEDEEIREDSGFGESTYRTIMDRINKDNTEGKRLFIKDMAQYMMPTFSKPVSIAPSLLRKERGVGTNEDTQELTNGDDGSHFETQSTPRHSNTIPATEIADAPYETFRENENPTVIPSSLLEQFHFAFLIRHPRYGIPSYYRCCIPPLDEMTGFHDFRPEEAGYEELRRLFDYLRSIGHVGPEISGQDGDDDNEKQNGDVNESSKPKIPICVIDADDLLDDPEAIISKFCESVGIDYSPDMLTWDTEEEQNIAAEAFEKWKGFHEDAIHSTDLRPRKAKHVKTDEEQYAEWVRRYGEDGAQVIRQTVDENVEHYEYLRQFAVKL